MDRFVVHELAPGLRVKITRSMPGLPPTLDAEVERLWRIACDRVAAGGAGTDGVVALDRQLLAELREELGLLPSDVDAPVPLCVVEHSGSRVSDIGMALHCALDGAAIRSAHAERGNGEYATLRIVPTGDLAAFLAEAGDAVVPPAPVFLARAGCLPGDGPQS